MKSLFSAIILTLWGTLLSPAGEAAWNIPDPEKIEHPGAKEAPASSPHTYPDEAGFQARAKLIVEGLATNDLGGWRRGFFTSNDPGKYLPGAAMAKLLLDPENSEVRKYQNDDRSYREHYHFAAVNWARFYPLFGDTLTDETKKKFSEQASRFTYFGAGGTENHKTMGMTSGNVLPSYIEGTRFSNLSKEEALARGKKDLRAYVKGLYAAGMGEWDSSTYVMFDVNGMLNIYDFAKDPETRLLAKAALDWLTSAYALKYRDGVYTAPNQRGFAHGPVQKIADQTGWLWWDSHHRPTAADTKRFLYTMHPVTSGWRPNSVISHLATQDLPDLPFEARNAKPNYWYGQGIAPKANEYQESVFVAKHYTLGSLWNGFGGQTTRFQLVADSPVGGIVFTGGNPRKSDHTGKLVDEISYEDGNGRYDQSAQVGSSYVSISNIPDNESLAYSFFSIPLGATKPVRHGKWWIMQAGETLVGLYPLSEQSGIGESDLDPGKKAAAEKARAEGKEPKDKPFPILRCEGRRTGFILQVADTGQFPSLERFAEALMAMKVDAEKFPTGLEVSYTNLEGKNIRMKYQDGQSHAAVSINGQAVRFGDWAVYDSPYLRQKDGILTVNDGRQGFVVDFTGELPVYRPWSR